QVLQAKMVHGCDPRGSRENMRLWVAKVEHRWLQGLFSRKAKWRVLQAHFFFRVIHRDHLELHVVYAQFVLLHAVEDEKIPYAHFAKEKKIAVLLLQSPSLLICSKIHSTPPKEECAATGISVSVCAIVKFRKMNGQLLWIEKPVSNLF